MNDPSKARFRRSATQVVPLACATIACLAPNLAAQSQVIFSVDYNGGTIGTSNTLTGSPIRESDLMRAPFVQPSFGPLPAPQTLFDGSLSAGGLGLTAFGACISPTPGLPCHIEVDAISFGNDAPFDNSILMGLPGRARIYFSVDRLARGVFGSGIAPNVFSEAATGVNEAAADVFTVVGTIVGPLGVPPTPGLNTGVFDGNGLPNTMGVRYRGLGLKEQGQFGPFDDLDALTIAPVPSGANAFFYFSLDGAIVDPQTLIAGTNSAAFQGVPPSAILRRNFAGGPVQIYATPAQLGFSMFPMQNDVDALLIADNGNGTYQPSLQYYDWLMGGTDMVLFSVRRGSQMVGQTSSGPLALAIEPGDILAPPLTPGANPRIFIAAENLGLRTERTNGVSDELDALASAREPYLDCNMNGRDDAEDIAVGFSSDTNANGIPDDCEKNYSRYCFCESPKGPCGNHSVDTGCLNNTGLGGLLCGVATTSVATDDLELLATQLPPFSIGLLFMSPSMIDIPFGDGRLCAGPTVYRMGISGADVVGTALFGPGFVATSNAMGGAAVIHAGDTRNFQVWYRDAAVYCTPSTYNLTNGLSVVFSP